MMASSDKILVTGAAGTTGSGLVFALRKAGVDVRAFVHNESKAERLKEAGAEIFIGDLDKPETIEPALEGIGKAYFLTWNGPSQAQQGHDFIEVARRVGKPYIVRHSMWGADSRIIRQGDQVEEELKASGLPWTILKPTFFMQNTLMAKGTIASDGIIYWDMGDGKLAMIDTRDIVDAAAAVLTGIGNEGKSYILTGPEAISMHDVARIFTKVLGKDVQYVSVPGDAAVESMTSMGFPEWIARGYAELSEGFSRGFASQTTDNVEKLTNHPARSFEQFARDFSEAFGKARKAA